MYLKFARRGRGELTCRCGDTYGKHGQTNGCTTRCFRDPDQYCGGENKQSIFRVDGKALHLCNFQHTFAAIVIIDQAFAKRNQLMIPYDATLSSDVARSGIINKMHNDSSNR